MAPWFIPLPTVTQKRCEKVEDGGKKHNLCMRQDEGQQIDLKHMYTGLKNLAVPFQTL